MKNTPRFTALFSLPAAVALGLAACAQVPPPTPTVFSRPLTPAITQPIPARTPLTSMVIDTEKLPVRPSAVGSTRTVFSGPTVTLNNFESHITTVNPGQAAHAPHTHGNDEMLLVKEGTLQVILKDQTYQAGPGSLIYYSSLDPHGTFNTGTTPVTYYVFSWMTDKTPNSPSTPVVPGAAPAASTGPITASLTKALPTGTKLTSTVFDTNKIPVESSVAGEKRSIFNGPTATLKNFEGHITTVNPRQAAHMPPAHGNEEFILVTEGMFQVAINDQTYLAGPGSLIFYAPNEPHGILNVGDSPASYYVFIFTTDKTPPNIGAANTPAR